MYLKIGEKQYSVSRRVVTEDTIKYLSVTPDPGEVTGKIQMYRDDGFLFSEDDAGNYTRQTYAGTLLTLTNQPVPEPAPQPSAPNMQSQYAAAMRAYAATSVAIPDTYALDMPDLFPAWETVLEAGEELPAGRILNDGVQLYRVVQAVGQLTKRPDITYFDYIEDISCNPLAARVKAAEIRDNLDAVRVNKMSFCTFSLEERAQKALKLLEHC